MKPFVLLLAVLSSFLSKKSSAQSAHEVKQIWIDTNLYHIDTIIHPVQIASSFYSIALLRDKLNEQMQPFGINTQQGFDQSPATILVWRNSTQEIVYKKKFDFEPGEYPYCTLQFYKGQEQKLSAAGQLYLSINKSYGGSGSISNHYYFKVNQNKIALQPIAQTSGELALLCFHENDQSLLMLEGIWNMNENEAHYSDHRYKITHYRFTDNEVVRKVIGKTKNKYPCWDEYHSNQKILAAINKKEPQLLRDVDVKKFR